MGDVSDDPKEGRDRGRGKRREGDGRSRGEDGGILTDVCRASRMSSVPELGLADSRKVR